MSLESRLKELGLTLPVVSTPTNNYVSVKQAGTLLFVAGHGPKKDGSYPHLGKVGSEVTLEQARESARLCIINCLASIQHYLGDLDKIKSIVKVVGYVSSTPTFTNQPKVINAASDLLIEIFGEAGRHARSAVGMAVLPSDIPVEIEMVVEVS
jgi:enamine deaminase RidA (YjgF/YER057c/UK114 family)